METLYALLACCEGESTGHRWISNTKGQLSQSIRFVMWTEQRASNEGKRHWSVCHVWSLLPGSFWSHVISIVGNDDEEITICLHTVRREMTRRFCDTLAAPTTDGITLSLDQKYSGTVSFCNLSYRMLFPALTLVHKLQEETVYKKGI